jgi:two-component system sensor histidine kinase FlrB
MQSGATKQRNLTELKAAFDSFNTVSDQLQTAYADLQQQVARLQEELQRAQQERAEEARRNADLARRLSALLEALPGGVIMLDESGIVREINSSASDFLGDPLQDLAWKTVCQRAFRGSANEQGDLTLQDGRQLSLAQKAMTPEPGRVLLLTDVTEHRKFEELLARHRRLSAMGEMAAALAHQIRTPLSAALLYTSNAARPKLQDAQRDSLLTKAAVCLHDLEQLIGDMLQFARGASYTETVFSINDLLESVETSVRPIVLGNQQLQINRVNSPIHVTGNREALIGAVLNLTSNALQSAGEDARVEIEVLTAGHELEIRVSDNGPGVAAENRDKIFDPFYTSRPDGTGLGLAVVRSVAHGHGGDIVLDDNDRSGATFILRLPMRMQSGEELLATSDIEIALNKLPEDAAA